MHEGLRAALRAVWCAGVPAAALALTPAAALVLAPTAAQAARVQSISPQGEVAEVRQLLVRFSDAVVAAGDVLATAPYTLNCQGTTPPGDGHWLNERSWARWPARRQLRRPHR